MNEDLQTAMERVDPRDFATRGDYRLRMLAELLAIKLERRRDRKERLKRILLKIRSTIKNEGRPRYLDNWERTLSEGWPSVKKILQSGDERSLELLHSFPFAGEVTENDRLRILLRSHGRPQSELRDLKRRLAEANERIENNVI